eukprot:scaffold25189_cov79-Isochrysis_galbana.AAC.1
MHKLDTRRSGERQHVHSRRRTRSGGLAAAAEGSLSDGPGFGGGRRAKHGGGADASHGRVAQSGASAEAWGRAELGIVAKSGAEARTGGVGGVSVFPCGTAVLGGGGAGGHGTPGSAGVSSGCLAASPAKAIDPAAAHPAARAAGRAGGPCGPLGPGFLVACSPAVNPTVSAGLSCGGNRRSAVTVDGFCGRKVVQPAHTHDCAVRLARRLALHHELAPVPEHVPDALLLQPPLHPKTLRLLLQPGGAGCHEDHQQLGAVVREVTLDLERESGLGYGPQHLLGPLAALVRPPIFSHEPGQHGVLP